VFSYQTSDEQGQLRDLIGKARARRDAEMRSGESDIRPEVQTPPATSNGQDQAPWQHWLIGVVAGYPSKPDRRNELL